MKGKKQDAHAPQPAAPEEPGWQYRAENTFDEPLAKGGKGLPDAVEWSASEYIEHKKGFVWYVLLALFFAGVSCLMYLVTRDPFPVGAAIAMGFIVGISASRKPRTIPYRLDGRGVTVRRTFYPYESFKSYSIIEEGAFESIMFLPLRRFGWPLSIYFAPEDEARILKVLALRLPAQLGEVNGIDRLMRKIRF